MKWLLFLAVLLPATLVAQKIALIDRGFKRPIVFADSATMEQLVDNYFPIHVEDLRHIITTTDRFIATIHAGWSQTRLDEFIPAGKSIFFCSETTTRKSIFHNIVLGTRTNAFSTSMKLVQYDDSPKRAIQKLLIFTDYVKNNLAVADEANRGF